MTKPESDNAPLFREAEELARKLEEMASYHAGTDLVERLHRAQEGQAAQREQMLAAAAMIGRLLEARP